MRGSVLPRALPAKQGQSKSHQEINMNFWRPEEGHEWWYPESGLLWVHCHWTSEEEENEHLMIICKRIPSYISSLKCCQWDKKPSKFREKNQSISTKITAKITLWPGNSWKLFNRYTDLPAYNGSNLFIALWLVVITKYGEQLICSTIRDWLKNYGISIQWNTMQLKEKRVRKNIYSYLFEFSWRNTEKINEKLIKMVI